MKKIIEFGISSIILWSCNNFNEKPAATQQEETHATHQHKESFEALELNNGEKWKVNDEMKPFVQKGEELVNTYIQKGKTDYKTIAEQIKDQNSQLIKSCTMDGKSHDELHKWLHPHLELVKELENESNVEKVHEIISKIQYSYNLYHQYFN
ncbi:MAG: hypothetical protein M9959_07140 [Chitinophagaceae bacterium]|nr:hypothetical protein [Chitinophagaceae bacterium]